MRLHLTCFSKLDACCDSQFRLRIRLEKPVQGFAARGELPEFVLISANSLQASRAPITKDTLCPSCWPKIRLWVKIKPLEHRRFSPYFHLPGFLFWAHIFDPLPFDDTQNQCTASVSPRASARSELAKCWLVPRKRLWRI